MKNVYAKLVAQTVRDREKRPDQNNDSDDWKIDAELIEGPIDGPTETGIRLDGVNVALSPRARKISRAVWETKDRSVTWLNAEDTYGKTVTSGVAEGVRRDFNTAMATASIPWEMSIAEERFTIRKTLDPDQ